MIVILILTIGFIFVYLIWKRFRYFRDRSIPSPPLSSLIYGHLPELWSAKLYSEQIYKWSRQYGSVYGLFEGTRPAYVISDIRLIEEVFITQFNRFYSRGPHLGSEILGHQYDNLLSTNISNIWKRQRKILNPTFSGAKMKRLLPTVQTCVDIFMEKIELVPLETIIDVYDMFKRLTIDVICRCAFSIDTEVQNETNNIYMQKAEEFFSEDFERSTLGRLHRILAHTPFAFICSIIFRLQHFLTQDKDKVPAYIWLMEHMNEFIQRRYINLEEKKSIDDLLQLMLGAIKPGEDKLLHTELLSNVFVTLLAGYETSSTALAYCSYRLAIHQDIQQKLFEEIQQNFCSDVTYEGIMSKLTYLDMFVREVFRMHPIAIHVVHRLCMEDTNIIGHHIQKGTLVYVDVLSVHYDQELWGPESVDEFHPERHSCKRHPLSLLSFGAGPRTCIGMRFALMEIKVCLARLIHQYKILPPTDEKYELKRREGIVIVPEQLLIKLQKR